MSKSVLSLMVGLSIIAAIVVVGGLSAGVSAQSDTDDLWDTPGSVVSGSTVTWQTEKPALQWKANLSRECAQAANTGQWGAYQCSGDGKLEEVGVVAKWATHTPAPPLSRFVEGVNYYGAYWSNAEAAYVVSLRYSATRSGTKIGQADTLSGAVNLIKQHRGASIARGLSSFNELRQITKRTPIQPPPAE